MDQILLYEVDLQNKLVGFENCYNNHRMHGSIKGDMTAKYDKKILK